MNFRNFRLSPLMSGVGVIGSIACMVVGYKFAGLCLFILSLVLRRPRAVSSDHQRFSTRLPQQTSFLSHNTMMTDPSNPVSPAYMPDQRESSASLDRMNDDVWRSLHDSEPLRSDGSPDFRER